MKFEKRDRHIHCSCCNKLQLRKVEEEMADCKQSCSTQTLYHTATWGQSSPALFPYSMHIELSAVPLLHPAMPSMAVLQTPSWYTSILYGFTAYNCLGSNLARPAAASNLSNCCSAASAVVLLLAKCCNTRDSSTGGCDGTTAACCFCCSGMFAALGTADLTCGCLNPWGGSGGRD